MILYQKMALTFDRGAYRHCTFDLIAEEDEYDDHRQAGNRHDGAHAAPVWAVLSLK
jgi:hypothetical protein